MRVILIENDESSMYEENPTGKSDQSNGRHGRAFLFSHAMNIGVGPKEDRQLTTGLHTVADIHCADCRQVLGWKYERAYEASQKYKEGKFILEKSKIVKENW
ncbi:Protein yippee-like [Vitis vinifera]|uniref:Protein yippee-like n=1 Tax=Vitis vinifera TaxID=29760 RepID=A0A438BU48_VITVI|nr:Protein yippee-like [Vitis vinifera]